MYYRMHRLQELDAEATAGGSPAEPVANAPAPAEPAANAPATAAKPEPTKAADPKPADKPADPPAAPAQKWQDTWREDMAGTLADDATPEAKEEHEKTLKMLKRFTSPAALAQSLREQQRLISSGALKKGLPAKATEEQIKEWRAENGIPESPDKYELKLPDGLVLGDTEKPLIDEYVKALHGENATPAQVNAGVAAYLNIRNAEVQRVQEQDVADSKATEDELRAEWGGEYRTNIASIEAMLGNMPKEAAEALKNARGPGGKALINNPGIVAWLAGQARVQGFVGATMTPNGGDLGKTVDDEIAAIEATQFNKDGTKNPAYWKSDKAIARYSQLLESRNRLNKA